MPQIDKKKNTDSDTTDKDVVSMEAYKGIPKEVISELMKKEILPQIEAIFKNRAAEFIAKHCYINEGGKLVVKALDKSLREYIIGVRVNDISWGSFKYALINKFILIKIANYSVVYDSIEAGLSKPSDYIIKKQKNGSMRLQNVNRSSIEFEIQ